MYVCACMCCLCMCVLPSCVLTRSCFLAECLFSSRRAGRLQRHTRTSTHTAPDHHATATSLAYACTHLSIACLYSTLVRYCTYASSALNLSCALKQELFDLCQLRGTTHRITHTPQRTLGQHNTRRALAECTPASVTQEARRVCWIAASLATCAALAGLAGTCTVLLLSLGGAWRRHSLACRLHTFIEIRRAKEPTRM